MLSKCLLDGTDHTEALMEIRNTPQQGIGTSSAQRMFGRKCRTMVPTPTAQLQSRVTQADNQQVKSQKRKQVKSYDRYKAWARPLDTGSSVMMKQFNTRGKQWRRGYILQRLDKRSYLVQASSGPAPTSRCLQLFLYMSERC